MKKIIAFGLFIIAAFIIQACAKEDNMSNKKILVAYYSYSGNTKQAAEKIAKETGGDLFEIKPEKNYPNSYNSVVELAKEEKQNNINPKLKDNGSIANYDIIFIGTPVWWYTMAGPVRTFISKNNFDGKVIAPFCTHGGGGASSTYSDMQKLAPNAKVLEGFATYENSAKIDDIKAWLKDLKI